MPIYTDEIFLDSNLISTTTSSIVSVSRIDVDNDINLGPFINFSNTTKNHNITGSLTLSGTINVNGSSYLGNASTDTTKISGNIIISGSTTIGDSSADNIVMNAGSITINGGSLNIDNNTLYVNSTLDKIGIGTSSPLEKLDVRGNTLISGSLYIGSGSNNAILYLENSNILRTDDNFKVSSSMKIYQEDILYPKMSSLAIMPPNEITFFNSASLLNNTIGNNKRCMINYWFTTGSGNEYKSPNNLASTISVSISSGSNLNPSTFSNGNINRIITNTNGIFVLKLSESTGLLQTQVNLHTELQGIVYLKSETFIGDV